LPRKMVATARAADLALTCHGRNGGRLALPALARAAAANLIFIGFPRLHRVDHLAARDSDDLAPAAHRAGGRSLLRGQNLTASASVATATSYPRSPRKGSRRSHAWGLLPAQKMLSIALRFTMNRRNGVGGVAGAFNGFTIAAGAGEYSAFMPWKACRNNWSCQKRHPASEQTANRAMFVCDFKLKPWRSAQYYAEMR
jgi:hypothetical protein